MQIASNDLVKIIGIIAPIIGTNVYTSRTTDGKLDDLTLVVNSHAKDIDELHQSEKDHALWLKEFNADLVSVQKELLECTKEKAENNDIGRRLREKIR